MSPDPFVIEGAIAASEGRGAAAEQLFLAARGRDPRSRGARYLLAERYLATGRIAAGLIEMQALVGLQSRGGEVLGPALVAYARSAGAIPQLRAFFRRNPTSEPAILNVLAIDAANADLVLALASNVRDPVPDWRVNLLAALVHDRQYGRAYAIWSRLVGVGPSGGLFNPAFAALPAPPPFNWQFPQSANGVAEPNGEGGLEVLYYGRVKAVLATQLLVLPPGDYRMAMRVESAGNDGLPRWVVRCADSNQVIAQIPLRAGAVGGAFRVSNGCEAQWLELESVPDEASRAGELTIRGLRLDREGSAQ